MLLRPPPATDAQAHCRAGPRVVHPTPTLGQESRGQGEGWGEDVVKANPARLSPARAFVRLMLTDKSDS